MWFLVCGVACTTLPLLLRPEAPAGAGRCLMCTAPSIGCVLNSLHLVPLPTRSCRWSISWLGPVAGESGLAQDSLRRAVATVWRVCGLASPPPACCIPHVPPHSTVWVIFCWLTERGCWQLGAPPLLALWWFLTCGGRIPRQGQGRFSRA